MEIRSTVEQSSLILMKFHRGLRREYVQQRNESIENIQFPGPSWKSNYNIIARVTMFHLVCVKLRPNRDTHKNIQGVHCQDFSRFKVFFKNYNNKNFQKVLFKIIKKKKIKIITDIKKSSMILEWFYAL